MTTQANKEELKNKVNELRIKYKEEEEKADETRREYWKYETIIKNIENEERFNEALNFNISKYIDYIEEQIKKTALLFIHSKLNKYTDVFIEKFTDGIIKKSNSKFDEAHKDIIDYLIFKINTDDSHYEKFIHYFADKIFEENNIKFDDKSDEFKKMISVLTREIPRKQIFYYGIVEYYKNNYNYAIFKNRKIE
jgi:hypothetical protein